MWYFAWILGVGFAVLLAILNAMWGELAEERARSQTDSATSNEDRASSRVDP
jgi:cyd operon protein YbgT